MGVSSSRSQEPEREEDVHEILDAVSKKLSSWNELVQNMKTDAHSWVREIGLGYLHVTLVQDMEESLSELKKRVGMKINVKEQTRGPGAEDMNEQVLLKTCQDDVKRLHTERNELQTKVDKLTEDLKQRNKRVENLKAQQQKMEAEMQRFKDDNGKLHHRVKKVTEHSQKLQAMYEREQILTKQAQAQIKHEKEAKEKALKRLSEIAGNQLQFENPAITDLSDPCRPTNIAEMYTQLYDDEWTTAYAALCDNGKTEKENIQTLKHILMESMKYCKTTYEKQYKTIEQVLKSAEETDGKGKSPEVVGMVNGEEPKMNGTEEEQDKPLPSLDIEIVGAEEAHSSPTEPKEEWVSMIIHTTEADDTETEHKAEEETQDKNTEQTSEEQIKDNNQTHDEQDDFVILETPPSCPTSLTGQEVPATKDAEEAVAPQLEIKITENESPKLEEQAAAATGEEDKGEKGVESEVTEDLNAKAENKKDKTTEDSKDSIKSKDTTKEDQTQRQALSKAADISANDTKAEDKQARTEVDADVKQEESSETSLKFQSLYPEVKQGVHNVVKLNAPNFIKMLQKRFLREKHGFPEKEEIVPYVQKCVSVCWLMVIQKPQMVFFEQERGEKVFNKDLYKSYTKTGQTIDFVVWPPMLIQENGPIICKGIAECTD